MMRGSQKENGQLDMVFEEHRYGCAGSDNVVKLDRMAISPWAAKEDR
jgi:hypothetical protein